LLAAEAGGIAGLGLVPLCAPVGDPVVPPGGLAVPDESRGLQAATRPATAKAAAQVRNVFRM